METVHEIKQRLFAKGYSGLRAQGYRQAEGSGSCSYRIHKANGEILKCAVGQLIEDEGEAYYFDGLGSVARCAGWARGLEGEAAAKARQARFMTAIGVPNVVRDSPDGEVIVNFLHDFQAVHDANTLPEDMKEDLHNFAHRHNLSVPA